MRKLTMETSLAENFTKCHPQDQSPLYNKIPKELRDLIFEFATAPYEDLRDEQRYPENSYYYRPDMRGPLRSSTGLLGTCRRVWLESSNLPMKQSISVLWRHSERGPPKQLEDFFAQRRSKRQRIRSLCVLTYYRLDKLEPPELPQRPVVRPKAHGSAHFPRQGYNRPPSLSHAQASIPSDNLAPYRLEPMGRPFAPRAGRWMDPARSQ